MAWISELEESKEEAREEGREEMRGESIRNMIEAFQELNVNVDIAAQKVKAKYPGIGEEFIISVISKVYNL